MVYLNVVQESENTEQRENASMLDVVHDQQDDSSSISSELERELLQSDED